MKTNRRRFLKMLGLGAASVPVATLPSQTNRKEQLPENTSAQVIQGERLFVMKTDSRIGVFVRPGHEAILEGRKNNDWQLLYSVTVRGAHVWLCDNQFTAIRLIHVRSDDWPDLMQIEEEEILEL